MKHSLSIILLFITFCASGLQVGAQNVSVNCVHHPDWEQTLRQARQEKKLIFVDCGASWCNPCKRFAAEVLTNDSVAAFFNANFISVYVDIDKDELPPVAGMPPVRSVPALFFVDAAQGEVVHGRFGFHDAPSLMRLARAALSDDNIASLRRRHASGQLDERATARFFQALREARHTAEYNTLLPQYLDRLTAESLQDSCVWRFCEQAMTDATSPVFRLAWDNRQTLADLYGEKRVTGKLLSLVDNQIAKESDWTSPSTIADTATFERLYAWAVAADLPDKENYLLRLHTEKAARARQTRQVLDHLREAWKSSWDASRKTTFIKNYINKIYVNGTPEEQKACVALLDGFLKQTTDKSTLVEFHFLESKIWKALGDNDKAKEANLEGQRIMNPHLFK